MSCEHLVQTLFIELTSISKNLNKDNEKISFRLEHDATFPNKQYIQVAKFSLSLLHRKLKNQVIKNICLAFQSRIFSIVRILITSSILIIFKLDLYFSLIDVL